MHNSSLEYREARESIPFFTARNRPFPHLRSPLPPLFSLYSTQPFPLYRTVLSSFFAFSISALPRQFVQVMPFFPPFSRIAPKTRGGRKRLFLSWRGAFPFSLLHALSDDR